MGISKVIYDDDTLIDLTDDTVTPQTLLEGYSAHGANGEPIRGIGGNGSNLATIEYTTTASKNYNVGNYLVYDGVLYKVTQAISSGDTITIGTNVTADKVGDELNIIENEVADIVNVYGSKNLLPYPYEEATQTAILAGITWTDNGDGTITANGTATANSVFYADNNSVSDEMPIKAGNYTLSGCPQGSNNKYYIWFRVVHADSTETLYKEYGDTLEIQVLATDKNIRFGATVLDGTTVSNIVFKPMLRLASIEDDTYVPYVPTNAKLDEEKVSYDDAAESVQKNLLPYPYVETTKTKNGVTFTDLGDGTIKANGTATANTPFYCTAFNGVWRIPNGTYTLTGCPSGGSNTTYRLLAVVNKNNTTVALGADYGDGVTITVNGDDTSSNSATVRISCEIKTSTVNNIIFKPMLRKATIKDDTWQPYILNNNQLVGWTQADKSVKKNLLPYPYYEPNRIINGITFTDNGDGTVTANGTATANADFRLYTRGQGEMPNELILQNGNYKLSGCPQTSANVAIIIGRTHNGTWSDLGIDRGDGADIVLNGDDFSPNEVNVGMHIRIANGATVSHLTFKPMLRLASIKDDTWAPYIPDNTELVSWKANGVLGAKNLIPYPYDSVKNETYQGVTFTVYDDGSVKLNGTSAASFSSRRFMYNADCTRLRGKRITLTGCPNGGSSTTYRTGLSIGNTSTPTINLFDTGDGVSVDVPNDANTMTIYLSVGASGVSFNNLMFYPMLRLAEDTDDTYQPYAMTNRELTENVTSLNSDLTELTPTLLWTNPNPNQAFTEQDINIDISDYKFIEIYTNEWTPAARGLVGIGVTLQKLNRASSSGKLQYMQRGFNMQDTSKISISDCTVYTDGQTAGTTVNLRLIPTYIYGIKR